MLMNVSENLKEGAQFFVEYKIKNASDLKEFSMRMKEYESKVTHLFTKSLWS